MSVFSSPVSGSGASVAPHELPVGTVTLGLPSGARDLGARAVRPVGPAAGAADLRLPRDTPAGPPPAFKVTILQRLRDIDRQPEPVADAAASVRFGRGATSEAPQEAPSAAKAVPTGDATAAVAKPAPFVFDRRV
jgi:hypothetical protein